MLQTDMILSVEGLYKSFTLHQQERIEIVGCHNVNLFVRSGEFIGITGKSGSGKSSLLKCIFRSYLPSAGHIYFASSDWGQVDLCTLDLQTLIDIRRYEIGYVSQFLHPLPRVTAHGMVCESLQLAGWHKESTAKEAERMLDSFQLAKHLWHAYPNTFSGGEKLRLNLAIAMVKQPRILLLDEPTASLDRESKDVLRKLLLVCKQNGTSMLGIFHDLEFMDGLVDRVYEMQNGILKKSEGVY